MNKRWNEGRWLEGSLVCTLPYWSFFPIPIARILGFLLGSILGSHCFWKLPYGVPFYFTGRWSSEFASRLPRHLRKKACTMWVLRRDPLYFWGGLVCREHDPAEARSQTLNPKPSTLKASHLSATFGTLG